MTLLDAIVLGLALCVDSLAVSTSCALKCRMAYSKGLQLAITFAIFQGGFPLIGALLGDACQVYIERIDHWIAFALLLLVGGKMLIDGIKGNEEEKSLDINRYWVICTLAVATSIDAFVVGIGFGLSSTIPQILMTAAVIAIITFLVSILGVLLGKRNIPIPERWASIIAGIVLIGLGTKTLFEHTVMLG